MDTRSELGMRINLISQNLLLINEHRSTDMNNTVNKERLKRISQDTPNLV